MLSIRHSWEERPGWRIITIIQTLEIWKKKSTETSGHCRKFEFCFFISKWLPIKIWVIKDWKYFWNTLNISKVWKNLIFSKNHVCQTALKTSAGPRLSYKIIYDITRILTELSIKLWQPAIYISSGRAYYLLQAKCVNDTQITYSI